MTATLELLPDGRVRVWDGGGVTVYPDERPAMEAVARLVRWGKATGWRVVTRW